MSLLVIDIDHFKRVNDDHGHQAGDRVLQAMGEMLQRNLRSDDQLFRFGGEEFVLLCDRLSAEAAHSMAERLRHSIEMDMLAGATVPVTVSIGVATGPEDGMTIEKLFDVADKRLYEAKRAGRNRVVGSAS